MLLKQGQWFEGWRAVARANDGRWVGQPDGVYVDPASGRVFALATVKGRSAEAFALAEVHARQALGFAAEPHCASPQALQQAEGTKSAVDELLDTMPACTCSTWDAYAHVDVQEQVVRVAVFWVGGAFRRAERMAQRRNPDGTVTFSSPAVSKSADLMPEIRARLLAEGRVLADPLGSDSRPAGIPPRERSNPRPGTRS